MHIAAHWRDGVSFDVATESGHNLVTDGASQIGGRNAGVRPMELVLSAAATCCGIDILTILNRGKRAFAGLSINVTGKRAERIPAVFTNIHVSCSIKGAEFKHAQRAVQMAVEKYCSVLIMLASCANVTWDVDTPPAK